MYYVSKEQHIYRMYAWAISSLKFLSAKCCCMQRWAHSAASRFRI